MILERPDEILNSMNIANAMSQTCDDWHAWTANNIVGKYLQSRSLDAS